MASNAREVATRTRRGVSRTTVDWTAPEPITETLATELATVVDDSSAERLWDRIDPEALDQLFTHARDQNGPSDALRVSFQFNGHLVTVVGNGDVFARPMEPYE